ncbi:MAG TPA: Ser-Thr-rich GPI-anchored membrane family protein, partial [Thermodesulfovibrionales bacterium]|nr:Ser-Thr-rich GPI-anchored membrane family protein [Thermodesulfovibrionales bacterium]
MKKRLLKNLLLFFSFLIVISVVHADAKLSPSSGIGFQGSESTGEGDHTSYIQSVDGNWAPPTSTMVPFDYYATGLDSRFWDALSVKFNTGAYSPSEYKATLRFYAQRGGYSTAQWNHYIILQGDRNPTYQDADWEAVANDPKVKSLGGSSGSWFEEELPASYWNSGSFWVTLRMWNVRVDAVELVLIPNELSSITVTSPNGGEMWQPGSAKSIQWTYTGDPGSNVRIELLRGGVLDSVIAGSTSKGVSGTGSYSWAIPSAQTARTDYQVKVTSVS